MSLLLNEIPSWVIYGGGALAVVGGGWYLFWDYVPNNRRTPLFRGEDGRFYYVCRGQYVRDPSRGEEQGNAAGMKTTGPVVGGFLVYKGHEIKREGDDILISRGKGDNGILGTGVHYLGLIPPGAVKIHTNKWEEWIEIDGKRTLVTFVRREYGMNVQITNMGGKTAPSEDKGNVPIEIHYDIYWRIVNPEKAKREVDDANYKALGLVDGEIVSWINGTTIYRLELDEEGNAVSASMDKGSLKDSLIEHLEKTVRVFEKVKTKYGYEITEFVVRDIVPLGGFAELLSLRTKTDLMEQAELLRLKWKQKQNALKIAMSKDWAVLYRTDPEAVARDIIDVTSIHGLPLVSGTVESLLRTSAGANGVVLSAEDIAKIAVIVDELLEKGTGREARTFKRGLNENMGG